ncbi:uncharacterized protein LOC125238259 [Leguminivora glycinivorella]|uniref:uncharacterized protein LOC125238259 n=1 Tax=Leguminivora glycinivorella TaxID=1035111 RepID=UPI00200FD8CC|nr:uncharacterized protein LOC125238259 [Leguminivora glycinivorella]
MFQSLKLLLCVTPCIIMFISPISSVDLPEDLKKVKQTNNHTAKDDTSSHCMEEFMHCLNPHTISPVCALNSLTDTKHPFQSICEMIHENCRSKAEQWHYLSDNMATCNGTIGNFTILTLRKE